MIILFLYFIPLFSLSVYSFSLIDPNITFFQSKWWEIFRNKMVYFGYYRREMSWVVYLSIVVLLFIFHYIFVKKYKQYNPIRLAIFIGFIFLFSYPFLSHDFFNYMFDARIATFYHQNPYFYKALDFPNDSWLRFMHWTHRTYPYGPAFILITLVPSFLSFGKFILSFLFFKMAFFLFYFLAIYYLHRLNKQWAIIFATSPLIIIEGLVNSHNDLISVSLGIIGMFYLIKNKNNYAWFLFLSSAAIKYFTIPLVILFKKNKRYVKIAFSGIIIVLIYLSLKEEIQPWYFLNIFIFLSFYDQFISRFNIFFFGLLASYYPYIRLGGWDKPEKVILKHWIIVVAAIINAIYLFILQQKKNEKN